MPDASKAILTESLTKIYRGKHIALNCVDLSIDAGSVLGILGPNGAGKTTLVKLLLGLQVPTAGRVLIYGQRMTPHAGQLRQRIGYLPADPRFPRDMTPIEYLDFVGKLGGLDRKSRRPKLAALLRAVELSHAAGDRVDRISTGMRTRLAIAASLINDPDLLIWDEPAHGLDPEARRGILTLMRNLAQSKTLVLSSHNLLDLQQVCTQAIVLHQGHVIYNGSLQDLTTSVKPSQVEIVLIGDRKEIAETFKTIQGMDELESCVLAKNLLTVHIRPDSSHATALANVLILLADHRIEMADLRLSGPQADQAIVDLLVKEGSRGITRAYQGVPG